MRRLINALRVQMISEIERKQVESIQSEEDLDTYVGIAAASKNPFFLQEYAASYNWDDGLSLPTAIANNKCCDLGTALNLFWLAEGMCYFTGEVKENEYNVEWSHFCKMIIERLTHSYYELGPVSFKPSVSRNSEYKYKQSGVPAVLYKEVVGV